MGEFAIPKSSLSSVSKLITYIIAYHGATWGARGSKMNRELYHAEEHYYVADLSKYALSEEEKAYDDYIKSFEQYTH